MTVQKIMVELDALLDTRQGTLLSYYPESINDIMEGGKESAYYNRITDDMGKLDPRIDSVLFKEYYRHRSSDVLRLSIRTNMVDYLRSYVNSLVKASISSPVVDGYEVHVNVYPYRLTEEETRLIGMAISNFILPPTKVSVINVPLSNMSTTELKGRYDMVILYNFVEWLRQIGPKIKTMDRTPSLVILAPMLFFDETTVPSTNDFNEMSKNKTDPFKLTTQACAEFFTLVFETIDVFSVVSLEPTPSAQLPKEKTR